MPRQARVIRKNLPFIPGVEFAVRLVLHFLCLIQDARFAASERDRIVTRLTSLSSCIFFVVLRNYDLV
jgi:hypothetical protein